MLVKGGKDLNKWRNILCSWIERRNIVKPPVPPKLIYRFNAIPTKIPAHFLGAVDEIILKSQEGKGTRIAKTMLNKKKKGVKEDIGYKHSTKLQ